MVSSYNDLLTVKTIFFVWTSNNKLLRTEHYVIYVHVINNMMIHMLILVKEIHCFFNLENYNFRLYVDL